MLDTAAGTLEHILHDEVNAIRRSVRGRLQPSQLDELIEELKQRLQLLSGPRKTMTLEALVVLQAPRAALAQDEMDKHKHGYHDRTKRLFELIDFNDSFVDAVLAQPPGKLPHFAEHLKHQILAFAHHYKLPSLNDEQYEAIVKGLSREIAVYLGAKLEGFDARMTSRAADAFGVDMVIIDPETEKSVNIDCKTPSAFRHRLGELVHEGRMSEDDFYEADDRDFVTVTNRHDNREIRVTTLCIRPEHLGEIIDFQFVDTTKLGELLQRIIEKN